MIESFVNDSKRMSEKTELSPITCVLLAVSAWGITFFLWQIGVISREAFNEYGPIAAAGVFALCWILWMGKPRKQ